MCHQIFMMRFWQELPLRKFAIENVEHTLWYVSVYLVASRILQKLLIRKYVGVETVNCSIFEEKVNNSRTTSKNQSKEGKTFWQKGMFKHFLKTAILMFQKRKYIKSQNAIYDSKFYFITLQENQNFYSVQFRETWLLCWWILCVFPIKVRLPLDDRNELGKNLYYY